MLKEGIDLEEEPKQIVWETDAWYKCPECKRVNLRLDPKKPNRICDSCEGKPKVSEDERETMRKLKAEIVDHTTRYEQKKANPPAGWVYSEDEDYWGRRNKIGELSKFGKLKAIWVWDGIPMY